jgi:hypothetical protein
VFSVFAHDFVPRTARETEGNAEPRFSRILAAIAASKYSIHDLSRSRGEGDENLARLNMLCCASHNIFYVTSRIM